MSFQNKKQTEVTTSKTNGDALAVQLLRRCAEMLPCASIRRVAYATVEKATWLFL